MSDPLPWRSERPLDARRVERIVDAQFPHLAPSRAEFLDEGWDTESWVVNGRWVLKFPKHPAVEGFQEVERAALPRLAPRLPLPVPVPSILGERGDDFPFRFWGHAMLPGVAADRADASRTDVGACADVLARFLSALHGVPVLEATAWGIPAGLPLVPRAARERERERWAVVRAAAPPSIAARVEAWLSGPDPALAPGEPVVTHGDLRDGNVLMDATGRAPVGVVDWIDLSVADPARDFGGLFAWLGEPFLRDVLARYDLPVDDGAVARARRRALHLSMAVAWQGALASRPHLLAAGLRGLDLSLAK